MDLETAVVRKNRERGHIVHKYTPLWSLFTDFVTMSLLALLSGGIFVLLATSPNGRESLSAVLLVAVVALCIRAAVQG